MNYPEHDADPPPQGVPGPEAPHMTPDELRLWGGRFLDWVAAYHERIEDFPVLSQVRPGEVADGAAGVAAHRAGGVRQRPGRP